MRQQKECGEMKTASREAQLLFLSMSYGEGWGRVDKTPMGLAMRWCERRDGSGRVGGDEQTMGKMGMQQGADSVDPPARTETESEVEAGDFGRLLFSPC